MNRAERRRAARQRDDAPVLELVELCDCEPVAVLLACGRIAECRFEELPPATS